MQCSAAKRVPTGASVLQKCVVPFAILMAKPAYRADLRISAEGPPFTTIVVTDAALFASGCEWIAAALAFAISAAAAAASSAFGSSARTTPTTANEARMKTKGLPDRCDIFMSPRFGRYQHCRLMPALFNELERVFHENCRLNHVLLHFGKFIQPRRRRVERVLVKHYGCVSGPARRRMRGECYLCRRGG